MVIRHYLAVISGRIRLGRLLNSGELDFYYFAGFVSGSFPSPVADRIDDRLREYRMSAFDVDGLRGAVGRDQDLYFNDSSQCHAAGERRVGSGCALQEPSFARFLRVGMRGSKAQRGKKQGPNYALPQEGIHLRIV